MLCAFHRGMPALGTGARRGRLVWRHAVLAGADSPQLPPPSAPQPSKGVPSAPPAALDPVLPHTPLTHTRRAQPQLRRPRRLRECAHARRTRLPRRASQPPRTRIASHRILAAAAVFGFAAAAIGFAAAAAAAVCATHPVRVAAVSDGRGNAQSFSGDLWRHTHTFRGREHMAGMQLARAGGAGPTPPTWQRAWQTRGRAGPVSACRSPPRSRPGSSSTCARRRRRSPGRARGQGGR